MTQFPNEDEVRHLRADQKLEQAPHSRGVPGLFRKADLQESILKCRRKNV